MTTRAAGVIRAPTNRRAHLDRLLGAGALLALSLGWLAVGPRHAPWFDEAQSWLLARDSDPVAIALRWARYEGSPSLWQAVLWAFQRLGGRYDQLWTVSAVCALGGAAAILFASPFPRWMRVGLVFTYFVAYQYALVARSYALDLLLIPLAAAQFPGREGRPVVYAATLGLLANTNAFGFIDAAILALELGVSAVRGGRVWRGRSLAALALAGVSLIVAVLQVWPAPVIECRCGYYPSIVRVLLILGGAFVQQLWPGTFAEGAAILGGAALTVMLAPPLIALVRRGGHAWLAAALLGGGFLFVGLVQTQYYHAGMILLAALFTIWVSWPGTAQLPADLRLWLNGSMAILIGYQVLDTAGAWLQELNGRPYSAARATAAWLEGERLGPGEQVGAMSYTTFALQPYFAYNVLGGAGPPGQPAFYRWAPTEGVRIDPDLADGWRLLRSGRYAWLVTADLPEPRQGALLELARRAGYVRVAIFPGQMIWKTRRLWTDRLLADDGFQIFRRCWVRDACGGGARPRLAPAQVLPPAAGRH